MLLLLLITNNLLRSIYLLTNTFSKILKAILVCGFKMNDENEDKTVYEAENESLSNNTIPLQDQKSRQKRYNKLYNVLP